LFSLRGKDDVRRFPAVARPHVEIQNDIPLLMAKPEPREPRQWEVRIGSSFDFKLGANPPSSPTLLKSLEDSP
jgi:hypothetical protein